MPVLQTEEMSQNGHAERSGAKRAGATNAVRRAVPARPVLPRQRGPRRRPQQPPLPLLLHLLTPPSRTLPHLKIRPVRATSQRYGHRQYLRTSREIVILRRRMGQKHPVLPRTPSYGPGRVVTARLVRTVRSERVAVLDAAARGAAARRGRSPRVSDGGGPCRGLHGPHTDLPGASGEAEGTARGLSGVFLSEGHRPLHDRRLRPIRRATHRKPTREVSVRPRGVLPESVPQPAHEVRQATPPAALPPHRQLPSHRTALLRTASRQNAHRDPHKGYAAIREFLLLAVHGDHVTYNVASVGSSLIHALRLPAVPATEVRPVPEVPTRGLAA